MKKTNRFIAMAAALTLTASAMIPMFAFADTPTASITINCETNHTFTIYQIFTGNVDADGNMDTIKWGSSVTTFDSISPVAGTAVDKTTIDAVLTLEGDAIAEAFTLGTPYGSTEYADNKATLAVDPGYYIIKDTTNGAGINDALSTWIVQVTGDEEITMKSALPTVDKQVYDNADGTASAGWGESADHAINESFQFKLTATIPEDADLASYETYKLKFNDTMSTGVTFEDIESVKLNGTTDITGYTLDPEAPTGGTWSLTIPDVKTLAGADWGTSAITVEVIYNAHLNASADVRKASATGVSTNNNKVNLEYSNNPYYEISKDSASTTPSGTDSDGDKETFGKTPDDYVWVFTYEVDNTKYKVSVDDDNKLPGASFQLHKGDATGNVIKLINNSDGTYTVANQTATEGVTDTMVSYTGGIFNIIGLDAGTYTLVETAVPANSGLKKCDPITITIAADHNENTGLESADLDLDSSENMNNPIVNTYSSALPSTGGIGTTLFYIGGGCMVGVAGILLITKKRAKNANN